MYHLFIRKKNNKVWKYFACKLRGHSLKRISNGSIYTEELECSTCKRKFTTDGYGRVVKYTEYWEENHAFFRQYLKEHSGIKRDYQNP